VICHFSVDNFFFSGLIFAALRWVKWGDKKEGFMKTFWIVILISVQVVMGAGPAAADYFVFPSPPDINSLGNLAGAYRDFSIFGQNTLDVAGYLNAVKMPAAAQVLYTPSNNTQPGWVNKGYDWSGGQHTYVINLPSPTGGQLPAVPGLHPWNGLQVDQFMIGGVSGLLVLYNVDVTLPITAQGFLDPAFLDKVTAIVAFVPGCSTAVVYEKSLPEPGVLLLLGFGLICIAGLRRMIKK
jgi:hypothetical protein